MPSINEDIADQIRVHSVDLLRFEAGVRVRIIGILRRLQRQLVDELRNVDPTGVKRTAFQQARMEKLLEAVRTTIESAAGDAQKEMQDTLTDVARTEGEFAASTLNQAIHANVASVGFSESQLKAVIGNALIEGAPSNEWWQRQGEEIKRIFADVIRMGTLSGETNQQLVARVRGGKVNGVDVPGIMDVTRRNAAALVRTSILKVSNLAHLETYRQNSDIVKALMQVSTFDSRTTDICMAYSGKQWDLEGTPIGHNLPFNGGPPRHWQCRSILTPVTKTFREMGIDRDEVPPSTRASMDGQVPEDLSFDDWMKRKEKTNPGFADDMLGVERARLWRENKITLSDLLNQNGRPLTLEELRRKAGISKAADASFFDPSRDSAIWHESSWTNAPDLIKDAIRNVPDVDIVKPHQPSAYYLPARKAIHMGTGEASDATSRQRQGTWRHEFGHHIDFVRGNVFSPRSNEDDFIKARKADNRELLKGAGLSGSKEARNARPFQTQEIYQNLNRERIEMPQEDRPAWFAGKLKKHDINLDDALRGLHEHEGLDNPNKIEVWEQNKMLELVVALETKDARRLVSNVLGNSFHYEKGIVGKVADLFGAITKNKIGYGHSLAYYKRSGTQGTEAFANVVAMIGDGNPFWRRISEHFAPNFTKLVVQELEDVAKAK